jgi:hypothetical protein
MQPVRANIVVLVPSLDALVRDPSAAIGLPTATLGALQAQCAAAQGAIAAALLHSKPVPQNIAEAADEMLTPDEAGVLLRKSRRWIYRHTSLPFVKRISRKSLLCSRAGIERWLAMQKA